MFGTKTIAIAIRVRLNNTQTFGHFVIFLFWQYRHQLPSYPLGPKVPLRLCGQKAASMAS